jgi:hypothetical protein
MVRVENAANLFESVLNRFTTQEGKDEMSFLKEQRKIVGQYVRPNRPTKCQKDAKKFVLRWKKKKGMLQEQLGSSACLALKALGGSDIVLL